MPHELLRRTARGTDAKIRECIGRTTHGLLRAIRECGEEVLEEQLSYWRTQLGTEQAALDLPTDRPRPAVQTYEGARYYIHIAADQAERLEALSQREGVTLFMALLAVFEVMLFKYTGQTDLCVGSSIAGRNRAEVEGLIGFFLNSLVLRADLSGNPTFRELLGRVRETALSASGGVDHDKRAAPRAQVERSADLERRRFRTPALLRFLSWKREAGSWELSYRPPGPPRRGVR